MPSRRSLLRSVGAGLVVGVAGCAAPGSQTPTAEFGVEAVHRGYERAKGAPEVVPEPLECEKQRLRRLDSDSDVNWGDAGWGGIEDALALRVEKREYTLGETVEIRMYNLSETDHGTRTREEFLVQLRTEAGWQTVFGYTEDGPYPFTDDAVLHEPGQSLTWNISLTADGIIEKYAHPEGAVVCPDLQPGRYRFVFPIDAPALAVSFDVTA